MIPSRTIALSATGAAGLASAIAYSFLPNRVATRFDSRGQPSREVSRTAAAVATPALMAGLLASDRVLGNWPGGGDREDAGSLSAARARALAITDLALLASHLAVLARAAGMPLDMARVQRGIVGGVLVALGNVMPTLGRNALIGIRTPWSLSDPADWERTQRVGGYGVTLAGILTLASLPFSGKAARLVGPVSTVGAVILAAVYSYLVRRRT